MDLIEPHVTSAHDRIGLDVSNLSLEKDCAKELSMKIYIRPKPCSIEIGTIVDSVIKKNLRVLRPIDSIMQNHIDKITSRGRNKLEQEVHVIPDLPPKYSVILVRLPNTANLYRLLVPKMTNSINYQIRIVSIEQIKNLLLQVAYLVMKELIAIECRRREPSERELFRGTKGEGIDGVLNDGYDDRY